MLSYWQLRALKPTCCDKCYGDGNGPTCASEPRAGLRVLRRRTEDGGDLTLRAWPGMNLARARVKTGSLPEKVRR